MRNVSGHLLARRATAVAAAAVVIASLGGCRTAPATKPVVPAPSLRLIESKPLVIAEECTASGSFFVEFTVRRDGRTDRIRPPPAPPCVQKALTAWVESFRYAPPSDELPGSIEWMLVTARKGS